MSIDINSDVGESFAAYSFGQDDQLLKVVSSANIACGFHGGDPTGIAKTVRLAAENNVVIGAHVSYPDLVGFGRRYIDIKPEDLTWDIVYQISALDGIAKTAGTKVRYVKPHGALYNRIAVDEIQAKAVVEAIAKYDQFLVILTLPNSAIIEIAKQKGIGTATESFADRAYQDDGQLVPRTQTGAVITNESSIVERVLQMTSTGTVTSIGGKVIDVKADSICIHSDTPNAGELGRKIREAIQQAGIEISSFVSM